jgi:ATP-dependent Clp protease ATP-binding subunit ClpC
MTVPVEKKVRRRPYSVILFDEIEKAHPDIFNLLLQVLDDGQLTDSMGRSVNFKQTVLIMTSNLGARLMQRATFLGFHQQDDETSSHHLDTLIQTELRRMFLPEFLNRLDEIITFHSLSQETYRQIVDLMIAELNTQLCKNEMTLRLSDEARDWLMHKGYDPAYGARPLRRYDPTLHQDPLAEEVLGVALALRASLTYLSQMIAPVFMEAAV